MAKKQKAKEISVISLRALCGKAGIEYHRVWSFYNDKYNTLTHEERTTLANTFFNEVTPILKKLGFYIDIKRIKDPVQ